MDMLDTVYVGHTICPVHGHNIFGMVVSDEIEVAEFSLDGIFRSKQVCNLHIDSKSIISKTKSLTKMRGLYIKNGKKYVIK